MRLDYLRIKKGALEFRFGERDLPSAFYEFIETHGIDTRHLILISAANWTQGINPLFGEILSQDERFFKYDLDFTKNGKAIIECLEWEDITKSKNLDISNKVAIMEGRAF